MNPDRDRQVIGRPKDWPHRPYLPVVRWRDGSADVGVILEGNGARVWRASWMTAVSAGIQDAPCESYDTIDKLLAAGWQVD